jgi:hypothetical protein
VGRSGSDSLLLSSNDGITDGNVFEDGVAVNDGEPLEAAAAVVSGAVVVDRVGELLRAAPGAAVAPVGMAAAGATGAPRIKEKDILPIYVNLVLASAIRVNARIPF